MKKVIFDSYFDSEEYKKEVKIDKLLNNIYEIITNHIEELESEMGNDICLTTDNKLYITFENEQVFKIEIKEEYK